jgi:CMP/dCMP kinase
MSEGLIIAIDGPAGSGKSTSAKKLADLLGYLYVDTGAMYRAITLLAIENNILDDVGKIIQLARDSEIVLKFIDGKTFVKLNDKDVTEDIRSLKVNQHVSDVSKISEVRKILVDKQREIGKTGCGIVMEGRDIGTVVFPEADVKIFLTASIDTRAERRTKEFSESGVNVSVNDILKNLTERDHIDSSRKASPLTKANDAIEIDTTKVTIEQQVQKILLQAEKIGREKGIKLEIKKSFKAT